MSGQSVPANSSAMFKATWTFDEPPVNSLVTLTFDWFDYSVGSYSFVEQRYDDPATIGDQTKQSAYLVFSPDTALNVSLFIYAKSTSKGTLTVQRIS